MEDNLVVVGVHAMLFDDDSAAAFIESAEALVPWSEDEKVLMDRYDVRHLLQDASSVIQRRRAWSPCDVSEEELDFERYRDLQDVNCAESFQEKQNVQTGRAFNEDAPTASGYSSVPFDYGGDAAERRVSPPASSAKDKIEEPFTPVFPVPEHLQPHLVVGAVLPPSQKIHQIISGTAKFVRERGGQAEIVLRVKQASNPNFGFLMPDHILHPYLRYLVDHPELTEAANRSPRPGNASITKPAEGLRLLGEVYGVDEEDEESSGSQKQPLAALEIKALKEPPSNLKLVIDKMVEFIARNGKEFEDVVRDRDKSDERFHFLHPWHEYHPYYLRRLQIADQANLMHRRRSSSESRSLPRHKQATKSPAPSVKPTDRHVSANDVNGKPTRARSRFDVPPSSVPLSPAKAVETEETEDEAPSSPLLFTSEEVFGADKEASNNTEQPGMSYDAAYAAVLAATRGIRKPKESSSGISYSKEAGEADARGGAKSDIKAERLKRAKQLAESLRSEEQNDAQVPESSHSNPEIHDDRHQRRRKRPNRDDEDRSCSEKRHRSEKRRHSTSPDSRKSRHADGHPRKDKRQPEDKHYSNKTSEEASDDIRAKVRAMLQQI